jgi:hypothetical protein
MFEKMPEKFDIIAVSTGHDTSLLDKLLNSVSSAQEELRIGVILIVQGELWPTDERYPLILKVIHSPERIGLSKARNLGLKFLFEQDWQIKHIIFPDDDSTFDSHYFKFYQNLCVGNQAYLAKIKNEDNLNNYRAYPTKKLRGTLNLLPYVASVSLIVPYAFVKKVGFFDENLGAGAALGSSEDLDYFLRILPFGDFIFHPEIYNLHPSRFGKYNQLSTEKVKNRFQTYTDGYLYVFFKHGLEDQLGFFAERALGGFLISALKLQFPLAQQYFWLYRYRKKRIKALRRKHLTEN